jgi:hypothetical protein
MMFDYPSYSVREVTVMLNTEPSYIEHSHKGRKFTLECVDTKAFSISKIIPRSRAKKGTKRLSVMVVVDHAKGSNRVVSFPYDANAKDAISSDAKEFGKIVNCKDFAEAIDYACFIAE